MVPWMPLKLSDLDCMGTDLQNPDQGINDDHPGFSDHEYRRRRDEIAQISLGYKMGEEIVRYNYSDKENKLWNTIWNKLKPKVLKNGCSVYIENFMNLEEKGVFIPDRIPQLQDINEYLQEKTNWNIKPVNGILS